MLRSILIALVFVGSSLLASVSAQSYDVQVVLQVDGFGNEGHAKLSAAVAKDSRTGLDYDCSWTGVIVLKFSDVSFSEEADAIAYTRRLLHNAGIEGNAKFLHVHAEQLGTGKC